MKASRYLFSAAMAMALALTTTGCSDSFLEVDNPTGENEMDYYSTQDHINEALISAYEPTHWPDWAFDQYNALNIDSEIMGDDFFVGGGSLTDMQNWQLLFNYEGNENFTLSSLWTCDYHGVKRANAVIEYLDAAPNAMSESDAKSIRAQARGLRVYYYNMLWHYFGNIPYYTENLRDAPYSAPQISADEVYANVIQDLEETIQLQALPMRWEDKEAGRISQAMLYMMYAEMVMYQNDTQRFPQALAYMKEIIADQGNYGLVDDFAALWDVTGEWGKESIWEINYDDALAIRDWDSEGWPASQKIGGTVLPTLIAPNGWTGGDGFDSGADGWGFLPVRERTYNMFAANDKRRPATFWDTRELGISYTPRLKDTGIWLGKYRPYSANNANCPTSKNLNYNNNYRYYRFAETLLNAAELSLRTGGSEEGEAKTYLNQVRRRAGLDGLSKATLDDILSERHLEFVGEGKRYWDLVRAEQIAEATNQNKATGVLVPDETTDAGSRSNSWTANKKYIPISLAEIESARQTGNEIRQNDYK